ncbi:hypothetical protein [Enterobacter hormaechei]|uniref:hypothetical protein n=1 Tax=Enterobacter hormaechei TaxID=158836 RepID=UPI002A750425|nr:hypothetical protein [Enterobacter hormaechei]MDY3570252.1 hypothetical protein [Enterobacter hormaechei]
METVLDALKVLGRANYRQVAERLRIAPVDALNLLRQEREKGVCDFSDGGWFIRQSAKPGVADCADPTPRLATKRRDKPSVSADPEILCQLLRDRGDMSAAALAALVNCDGRGTVSVMRKLERKGVVEKKGEGKGATWCLKVDTPQISAQGHEESELGRAILMALEGEAQLSTDELASKMNKPARSLNAALGALTRAGAVIRHADRKNITWRLPEGHSVPTVTNESTLLCGPLPAAQRVTPAAGPESIPSLTQSHPEDLIIPTARGIAREIRRTRAKLASLEKLRTALRNIRRHKNLLQVHQNRKGKGE